MANEEHLKILNQGVKVWNQWRLEKSDLKPNLRKAVLLQADLPGADLRGADLRGAILSSAILSSANLSSANLSSAILSSAILSSANLSSAILSSAILSSAILSSAILSSAILSSAILSSAILSSAILSSAILSSAILSSAILSSAILRGAILRGAILRGAILRGAILRGAILRGAILRGAILRGAILSSAILSSADLSSADLSSADLSSANLSDANLKGARLGYTSFGDCDLSEAKNLETVEHRGPSSIGVDTLYKSKGCIPESFLRGAGVPDEFIEQTRALFSDRKAIEFYSCFISYSSKDEKFARRLHSRLRDEDVRVWFAPEDMAGGQQLIEQIDKAIRVTDKLLLVLSDHSIVSEWVKTEIRRACKAEVKEKRRKLFPVALVDYETLKGWEFFDTDLCKDLAAEVRSYYIPGFQDWKDHDAFETAFKKLLKDLQAK